MARWLIIAAALGLGGCQALLGIDDPVAAENLCSPFDEDSCDAGETCDVVFDTGALDCRPTGNVGSHEPCNFAEECERGLSCVRGMCRTICLEPLDCDNADPDEGECTVDVSDIRVCDSNCDLTALGNGGCPGGFECEMLHNYANDLTPLCTRVDDGDSFALGQECYDLDQCAPTLACYDPDEDLIGSCTEICVGGSGGGPCPGECIELWPAVHGVRIGVCPLP